MKSRIVRMSREEPQFKCGDILEFVPDKEHFMNIKIIVIYLGHVNDVTFSGICLHVENSDGWIIGEISDCINYSCFKLFEGTLELSN